jgi:protein subunit release factor A
MDRYQELVKERAYLDTFREKAEEFIAVQGEIAEYESYEHSEDDELKEMAEVELPGLREKTEKLDLELLSLLIPPDPADDNNAIFEIRAGTGGDEAALFVGDGDYRRNSYSHRRFQGNHIQDKGERFFRSFQIRGRGSSRSESACN